MYREIAQIGNDIFNVDFQMDRFGVDEAIAIKHSLSLSKFQMRNMRYMLEHKGRKFQTTNELLEARKKLRPAITSILNDRGVTVDYKKFVQMATFIN